ncbi:MAG TPA: Xaa-Pro peptidase family protein [Candidatus Angelobacter sp.]|nr:Xaa-Pro peptidase family protein [Candidatus Angelobacter sp.]
MDFLGRQKKLAAVLRQSGMDALLVTHLPNIRYLSGFTGSAGVLLLLTGQRTHKARFYTDGRYTQQAQEEVRDAKVVIGKRAAFAEACEGAQKAGIKVLGFEAEHLSYSEFKELGKAVGARTKLKPAGAMVETLRLIKDADEIGQIRASVLLAASLFQTALSVIRPGVAEAQVAGELELQARRAGAEGMSFDTIVAAGHRSALPHGRASAQTIPAEGFIILDYGVILAGYCSDMTRTVHAGPVSRSHRRMYNAVREAQLASIGAVKPGVETGIVDHAGREVLRKAGYDAYFTHSTGHGVGIEVHELPRLARGQTQKLAPGMVITIEPGIYIPDEGGVRIEDMVLVTETGHEVLTPTTKDLITL